jgi:heat shock protein HslJ
MIRPRLSSALWPLLLLTVVLLVAACAPVQPAPSAEPGALAEEAAPATPERKTLYVNSERVPCTGVAPMMCLQVRESEDADWQFFYSGIDGFFFVPGYLYEIVVDVIPVENPPADGSSLAYVLVELVSKTPDYSGEPLELVGPTWLLRSFGEETMVVYDEAVSPVSITFNADGTLNGNAGCNNYFGGYVDDGSSLTFEPLGATQMLCDENAMAVEQAVLGALSGTQAYTINGNMLEIVYAGGVLTFQAEGTGSLAPAGGEAAAGDALSLEGTDWTLTSMDEAMGVAFDPAAVTVTALFDGMRVGGSSGCNSYGGEYSVDGDSITFGMMISTMMACPEEQMAVEMAYLQALQSGPATFAIEGSSLTLTTPAGVLVYSGVPSAMGAEEKMDTAGEADENLPLVRTEWALVSMDESFGVAFDPTTTPAFMVFEEDGSVFGNAGCNNFNGGYTDEGETIAFTPFASTRMMCPEDQMAVETALFSALQGSVQYSIEGGTLTMTTAGGVLVFEGAPAAPAEAAPEADAGSLPLVGTEWTLASFDESMGVTFDPATTEVTATFSDDGTLAGTSGCNRYFAGYTLDGSFITFEVGGSTMMACPEEQMAVEMAFLQALQGEAQYQISGNTLEIITGSGTLTFTGAAPAAEDAPAAEESASSAFTGTEWKLVAFDENMGVAEDPNVTEAFILFNEDGTLSGNGACNSFSGSYTADGSFVTFGAIATTMRACIDAGTETETAFFAALQGEAQVQVMGSTMELITGVGTLTFEAR